MAFNISNAIQLVEGFSELIAGSEISCVLVGASMIDRSLQNLLRKYLIDGNTSDRLLKNDTGIIGSLRAKADFAYVLGLLSKRTYKNILIVLEIRNKFGHNHVKTSFSNRTDIKELCTKFKFVNEENKDKFHDIFEQQGLIANVLIEQLTIFRGVVYEIIITIMSKEVKIKKSVHLE